MNTGKRLLAAGLLTIALSGCSLAPVYQPPPIDMPASFHEDRKDHERSPSTVAVTPDWWHVYGDPQLDALIGRVDVTNQTLRRAVALLRDARAQADAAHAAYFPTIGAVAAATNFHTSANVVGKSLAGMTTQDYLLGLAASWEPDLFGRIGNSVDAAQARVQASTDDVAAVRLSLQAEVAVDYFGVRSLDRETDLVQRTVDAYTSVLQLVTNRYRGGIAAEGDVAQAQAQLDSTRAQLVDLRLSRTQLLHALATLVGQPASTFALQPAIDAEAAQLPPVPAAVPSELLERRPDIAAAERRVAAANAQIGVARAAFFPSLMLNLTGGLESSGLSDLLTAPSRFWAIGPALAATIFDGGKRLAGVDSAHAQFDASAADYREVVLKAVQDAEDNYAAIRGLQDEAASQQSAVAASQRALDHAIERYRKGAVGYLDVNVIQAATLTNARALEAVHRRQLAASVGLFRALGGGWKVNDATTQTAPT